ncbi:MAG: small nuclear ribonucleoprotein [Candidatus Diapherotrites archaeon]|nr:small nuclear ribonucleoprotein [Candidatus Diapherotrites archaeon]
MNNRPFDLLNDAIDKEVLVVLKGNNQVRGTLKAFDVHMNLHLENASQLVEGEIKTKYGKVMVRGDSVVMISP